MKATLRPDVSDTSTVKIDRERTIDFMGEKARVYATPMLVRDIEVACRELLLQHLDAGEDSVGTHVSIDHLAATPMGLEVQIKIEIAEVDRRKVAFSFSVKDSIEEVGRGTHVRFVVETAKTRERLAAKRAKAGLK